MTVAKEAWFFCVIRRASEPAEVTDGTLARFETSRPADFSRPRTAKFPFTQPGHVKLALIATCAPVEHRNWAATCPTVPPPAAWGVETKWTVGFCRSTRNAFIFCVRTFGVLGSLGR